MSSLPADTDPGADFTISLEIENAYELYEDETTHVNDLVLPAPPDDRESPEFEQWAEEHIQPLTGVGHTDGNSWYDVTVTACSDESLVGHNFDWGY